MATNKKLFGEALRAAVDPVREELGKSDQERLDKLLGLAVAESMRLSDCLNVLFPREDMQKAQSALRAFRNRFNDASKGEGRADLGLRFEVDTKKKNPPEERFCWFTGLDPAVKQAERYSDQVTADIKGKPLVSAQGIATTGTAMASGKQAVRFFVSYAHADRTLVEPLVKELKSRLNTSARYEFSLWTDRAIVVGDDWRETIEKALRSCDCGLLMVSPDFLDSRFIKENELPLFVDTPEAPKPKPVVPVGLVPVSFDKQDLKGLQKYQFFFGRTERNEGLFYDQMPAGAKRREFANQLYLAIETKLDSLYPRPPPGGSPPTPRKPSTRGPEGAGDAEIPPPGEIAHFQRTRGRLLALKEMERLGTSQRPPVEHAQARDALEELEAWATDRNAPPFFALLGEYGIGKTTTLKQFTRDLLDKRKTRPELPLPIYVDLRDCVSNSPDKDSVPTTEQILASVIQSHWKLRDRTMTPEDIQRLVQDEGAVILFDGLDEKIVHLPPDRARTFIRRLWAVLPDAARGADPLPEGKSRGKLLISCRSHYFRDVLSQNSMLVGEDREGLERKQFPALCLLPFTEEQIRKYLTDFLGDSQRAAEAFEVMASIHNLRELAERPYLLKLISSHLGELEALRARREPVNAARLYEFVVSSWLNRDDGKHQLDSAHKRQLMEELAAALWREGSKQWSADRLEAWLDHYLAASPILTEIYRNKDRAVLKEDLRTATFVLRPTTEEKHFRFAHTSLQEYFLAAYLARALLESKLERWDMPRVSRETLDFLGQLLALEPQIKVALSSLETLLGGEVLRAAVLAFDYWLVALEHEHPVPTPTRVKLTGANLEEWHIEGRSPTQPLNLRRADLTNVRLNRARLKHVELADADLTGLQARQALFLSVNAPRARASGVDFAGLRWREGSLEGAELWGARLDGCQWIWVGLTGASLPESWERHAAAVKDRRSDPLPQVGAPSLAILTGHAASVTTCTWSPDGQRVLSGSWDNSLKVWDAASGECLRTLTGHTFYVSTCAWSPDGQRVLSGSADDSLKVWDAASGECLRTLSGHGTSVYACAWSPDGQRVLSGSADNSLKVWDVASGECLRTLTGHTERVTACEWSPDGQRVLSGSADNSLKVWDVASGECLRTLTGHTERVTACAWSPDGQRVLSGSEDDSLKVWDATSGECLRTLTGHDANVYACAWSPDGQRVLSGSEDDSLKVWDATSGECLRTLIGHASLVVACAWSPDGQRVLSGSWDNSLKVWDAASGECLRTLIDHSSLVVACAWSPDGQRVLSGSADDSLKVWDVASGECLRTLTGHDFSVSSCAWSPDGQRVLSGSEDDSLKVWDAASGECLRTLSGHGTSVYACAWSPDGQRVLSGSADNSLKVWDVASGECLRTLTGHTERVTACAWSPDGQRVLSGSEDDSLKVWDATSGECLRTLTGHDANVYACAWSPDGQRVLSGSWDDSLKVWDTASGECLRTLTGHASFVTACAWSPDGQRVLSGSWDNSLKVWDAASGECLRTLIGHASLVVACAWSPDGQRVLSGSWDNSLRVWDAASGRCLWSGHHFPEGQTASLDGVHRRILHASPEAWRWLGWRWTDPVTGQLRILPAETFGSLPA